MKKGNLNFYKWMVWSVLSISFIIVMFLRMSTGVISDNLSTELNFTSMQISNIASLTMYSYAIMQIPVGVLLDKYGVRMVCAILLSIAGSGSILFSISDNISMAYISRIMVGVGSSAILIAVLRIQSSWFKEEEFSSASSKFSLIGNIGTVVATFPLVMLNDMIGWRSSFKIIGIIGIIMSILIFLLVRNKPSEYGFENINKKEDVKNDIPLKEGLKIVMKNKPTWYNSFIMFSLVGTTVSLTSLWGIPYIIDVYNVSKNDSAFIVSFITYGMIAGSILTDILSSKIKTTHMGVVKLGGIINIAIWTIILVVFKGKPPIIMLPVAFFIIGCINMNFVFVFTDIKNNTSIECGAVATSIVNTFEFIGSGLINIFISYIVGNLGIGYNVAFLIFIFMNIITVYCANEGIKQDKLNKNQDEYELEIAV